jgi:hypothetical protein
MRTHCAAVFTAADAFHFDDLRAQVGQNHAGGGAGDDGAEVEDAYALEYGGQENEDSTIQAKPLLSGYSDRSA